MEYTYDPSTDAGKVRLLISDTSVTDAENRLFFDEEIATFLELEGEDVRLAAALGLETIARNEVQVLKVISILNLQTDGASTARELRFQAKELRDQVAAGADEGDFDIAEWVLDGSTLRQRLYNEALREGI